MSSVYPPPAPGPTEASLRAGRIVRSGVDSLIAACALRNGLMVLHHDRDFNTLVRVPALRVRKLNGVIH